MRIHVLSERNSCSHLSWANNFEFEDVIASTCDATIISPHQYFAHTRWEPVTGRLRKGRYRKVMDRGAVGGDLLIVVAMGPPALRMLHAVPGWRDKYSRVVAYVPDIYPPTDSMLDHGIVRQLDALYVSYSQVVEQIQARTETPVRVMQQAADVLSGLPVRNSRPVDVTAFGRQPEGVVSVMAKALSWPSSDRLGWWSPGTIPYSKTPQTDRAAFLSLLRASKATLCYRFEDSNPHQYRGVSPFTARWFEAAAAGAAIFGSQPSCPEASDPSMIQTVPLSLDGETAVDELLELLDSSVQVENSRRNLQLACIHHDWRHRIAQILQDLNMQKPVKLNEQIERLKAMAPTDS